MHSPYALNNRNKAYACLCIMHSHLDPFQQSEQRTYSTLRYTQNNHLHIHTHTHTQRLENRWNNTNTTQPSLIERNASNATHNSPTMQCRTLRCVYVYALFLCISLLKYTIVCIDNALYATHRQCTITMLVLVGKNDAPRIVSLSTAHTSTHKWLYRLNRELFAVCWNMNKK